VAQQEEEEEAHPKPSITTRPLAALAELFLQGACCRARNRQRALGVLTDCIEAIQENVAPFNSSCWEGSGTLGLCAMLLLLLPCAAAGAALALLHAGLVYAAYLGLALPLGLLAALPLSARSCCTRAGSAAASTAFAVAHLCYYLLGLLCSLLLLATALDSLLLTLLYHLGCRLLLGQWGAADLLLTPLAAVPMFAYTWVVAWGLDLDRAPTLLVAD
jgi:hypothetical protein